jgi:hypothetical protein
VCVCERSHHILNRARQMSPGLVGEEEQEDNHKNNP